MYDAVGILEKLISKERKGKGKSGAGIELSITCEHSGRKTVLGIHVLFGEDVTEFNYLSDATAKLNVVSLVLCR